MSVLSLGMMAVMLLLDPSEVIDAEAAAAVSEDADRVELQEGDKRAKRASIIGRSCDFDRKNSVMMFDGNVVVEYEDDCTLCADQVFAFLAASNQLSRVVAVGHVAVTNETRTGRAAMAVYRRRSREIELFSDERGEQKARLVERGRDRSELEGRRIRFWLDSEQVEVDRSAISVEKKKGGGGL